MCSVMGVVFVDVFSLSCIMSIGFLLQYSDPFVVGCIWADRGIDSVG